MWLGIISNSISLFSGILAVYLITMYDKTDDPFDTTEADEHGIKVARTTVFINITFSQLFKLVIGLPSASVTEMSK